MGSQRVGHGLVTKQQQRDRQIDGDREVYEEISTDITDIPTGICILTSLSTVD